MNVNYMCVIHKKTSSLNVWSLQLSRWKFWMNNNDNWKWHSIRRSAKQERDSSEMQVPLRRHSRHFISNADEFIKIYSEPLITLNHAPTITYIIKHWMKHKIMFNYWKVLWNFVFRLHVMLIMNLKLIKSKVPNWIIEILTIENFSRSIALVLCAISLSNRIKISHETNLKIDTRTIATMLLIRQSNVICIHYNIRHHFKIKWNFILSCIPKLCHICFTCSGIKPWNAWICAF